MIAIDANLLVYAYDSQSAQHDKARTWLEASFSSTQLVGLPLVSVLAFIRIATDRRLSGAAHSPRLASTIVGGWLARENVLVLEPGPRHWPIFFDMLLDAGVSGPRATDAHLAALAVEHGATFYTNDHDFRIFPQLDVRFPLRNDE